MAKIKYYYDTEACKYVRVQKKPIDVILNVVGVISLALVIAGGMLWLTSNYLESPKELILKNEVKELEFYYQDLKQKVDNLDKILTDMAYRDDNIYRVVLGAEPIDKAIREAGVGGSERYSDIRNKDISHEELIV